jgi:hypothetical protein
MTKKDVMKMVAGKELNILITEKVFKHKPCNDWTPTGAPFYGMQMPMPCSKHPKGCYPKGYPTEYSENITAAMGLFDYLRNTGKYCCLEIYSDYNYCWKVSLTKSELNEEHKPTIVVDGEENLPLAICKAALLTKIR